MPIRSDLLPRGDLLLIDEHGMDARKICAMLTSDTLTVVNVNSSVQAFLASRTHRYDVILARLSAREANPFRAFDLLQSHGLIDHTPFIYIAADAEKHLYQEAINRGVDSILTIPFSESDLRQTVASRMLRWRSHAEFREPAPPVRTSDSGVEKPSDVKENPARTIDASVVIGGASQAFERQRSNAGSMRVELEKMRVAIPITLLLRVISSALRAVDIPREGPVHIAVRLGLVRLATEAELVLRTAPSPEGLTGPLPAPGTIPSSLESVAQALKAVGGSLSWLSHPQFPALRVTFPVATGVQRIMPLDREPVRDSKSIDRQTGKPDARDSDSDLLQSALQPGMAEPRS